MAEVVIESSGPLFDGRAVGIVERYTVAARDRLAQEGENRVHARLHEVLRHPTGYYESHIHTDRQINDLVITDTPVVYGPWLEGVGSRNSPATRFPGYFTFRLVSQVLNAEAGEIAQRELVGGGWLEALNGV